MILQTTIRQTIVSTSMVLVLGAVALSCKGGGVGDPCIPNDEFNAKYPGATEKGAQIEDRSFQCETRVCLIKHFRGRVSCPYGNNLGRGGSVKDGQVTKKVPISNPAYQGKPTTESDEAFEAGECYVPGTNVKVTAAVPPQCEERVDQVYCSCRCAGADKAAKYCECPKGYTCAQATVSLDDTLVDPNDKYCIKVTDKVGDGYSCSEKGCSAEGAEACQFPTNRY